MLSMLKYIYTYRVIMLYTLNLYSAVCQLYLKKTEKNLRKNFKKENAVMYIV